MSQRAPDCLVLPITDWYINLHSFSTEGNWTSIPNNCSQYGSVLNCLHSSEYAQLLEWKCIPTNVLIEKTLFLSADNKMFFCLSYVTRKNMVIPLHQEELMQTAKCRFSWPVWDNDSEKFKTHNSSITIQVSTPNTLTHKYQTKFELFKAQHRTCQSLKM